MKTDYFPFFVQNNKQGRSATPPMNAPPFPSSPDLWDETLDLTPYINMSAYRVPETFSVERSYILFSTMGLRHLVVVDEFNRVRGMVTRKDLLGYRIDAAVSRLRRNQSFVVPQESPNANDDSDTIGLTSGGGANGNATASRRNTSGEGGDMA